MKPIARALALLTCCSILSACQTTRELAPVRPDLTNPERFDCQAVAPADRPRIPPEDVIDLDRAAAAPTVAAAVAIARQEVAAYVATVRAREGVAARYIVQIEGQLFDCANDDRWLLDYFGRLPAPE